MNVAMFEEIVRLEREGRHFAVCTVVEAIGSVPGKLGARMLLLPDGRQIGTIGGAGLEEKVKSIAREALASDQPGGLHRFDLGVERRQVKPLRRQPQRASAMVGGDQLVEAARLQPQLVPVGSHQARLPER